MPIETAIDERRQLTIFQTRGHLGGKEILGALQSFYENTSRTPMTLWDFQEASLSGISSQDAASILSLNEHYCTQSFSRKTALVVSRPYDFGVCKIYQAQVGMCKITRTTEVFYTMEEALRWLQADRELNSGPAISEVSETSNH